MRTPLVFVSNDHGLNWKNVTDKFINDSSSSTISIENYYTVKEKPNFVSIRYYDKLLYPTLQTALFRIYSSFLKWLFHQWFLERQRASLYINSKVINSHVSLPSAIVLVLVHCVNFLLANFQSSYSILAIFV